MSDWSIDYHLKELKSASGCNWVRDYSGADASALFRQLELARKRHNRIQAFGRTLTTMYKLSALSFVVGITLAVWSGLSGFDAGNPAGSLIVSGAIGFLIGFPGSFFLNLTHLDDLEEEVHLREDAYNAALQHQVREP